MKKGKLAAEDADAGDETLAPAPAASNDASRLVTTAEMETLLNSLRDELRDEWRGEIDALNRRIDSLVSVFMPVTKVSLLETAVYECVDNSMGNTVRDGVSRAYNLLLRHYSNASNDVPLKDGKFRRWYCTDRFRKKSTCRDCPRSSWSTSIRRSRAKQVACGLEQECAWHVFAWQRLARCYF